MRVSKEEAKFLSASETAKRLGISRMRVNQLINSKILKAERIGTVYAIRESDVEELASRERKAGRPPKAKEEEKNK
jgi:excisionase family DNA binding protein